MPGFTKRSTSPGYGSSDVCPERCSISGANVGNWSVYPSFNQFRKCQETMFYSFSLYGPVDEKDTNHKIYACSSYGPDFRVIPAEETVGIASAAAQSVHVEFEMGWFREGFGLAKAGIRSIVKQIRTYTENGHGNAENRPFIIYGKSGQATVGIYIGQGLLNQGVAESALRIFHDNLQNLNVSTPSMAMQLCGPEYGASHIFGIMATSGGTFAPIQDAIKSWANATCLEFQGSMTFKGAVKFTRPLVQNRTATAHAQVHSNSTLAARGLHARAECRTEQVESGDSCAKLAEKCGISGAEFTQYNPGKDFCAKLMPKQHVCCSKGDLPDFSPKPNEDGSCFTYQVKENDNCDNLAAQFSLTRDDLEDFNKNTWGWNGCNLLFIDTIMSPNRWLRYAEMNPCPLNACCNIWGQCGITKDFCVDTNTGAPGTAEPGTYGCISNCGMDIKKGDGNGEIKIGYYQGYCLSRDCLYQDPMQIDTSAYTHLHFGFATLTPEFDVEVGDKLSTYMFKRFKLVEGAKRILSFGGWAFSTEPETYMILRNGVKPANRLTMATKIANLIKEHDLDGVDINWEYPGAPDLPTFDPGTEEDGPNYLAFLVTLKNLLPGKSVSIAAPASYWYLQFPIAQISKVVDYIVYMTYDLHGQWDAHNSNSQEGCDTGNCLRSQVNLTETRQSLAMITKAGVPGKKVVVGVTSYGRSFKMAQAGCYGPDCTFTGDRLNSNAKKGRCTGTAGYIADAEIAEILADESRVVRHFVDSSSNSDILVYDETEWVGYMSAKTKRTRTALYVNWGLGGTSDWASDL
ncbi:glycoside hydrolase superfamily [Aspergillus spinulosporus]